MNHGGCQCGAGPIKMVWEAYFRMVDQDGCDNSRIFSLPRTSPGFDVPKTGMTLLSSFRPLPRLPAHQRPPGYS